MASYANTAQRQLRALTGSSEVREIDTGFASLAADVDAAIARPLEPRAGYLVPGAALGSFYPLWSGSGGVDLTSNGGRGAPGDALYLDKTSMVPAGRGWEWRLRSKLWVNDTAVPALGVVRIAAFPATKVTPGTHEVFMSWVTGAEVGVSVSAAALAAGAVASLDSAWFAAPDTATNGTEWLLGAGMNGQVLAANGRVYVRAWLETRFT